MNQQIKFTLALMQIENAYELIRGNQFEDFFALHLLPIKFELERQLTNLSHSSKIKE